jgi:hypothetical protein
MSTLTKTLKVVGSLVALLLLLTALSVAVGYWRFNRKVAREIDALFAAQPPAPEILITEAMLTGLPAPMQRYLRYSEIVGKPMIHTVRLKQTGRFRTAPGQPWLDFHADQYYTVDTPGFLWNVTMSNRGIPFLIGRDLYRQSEGNMLITVGALITVADAHGPEMDQGTMLRYLNELMWFPTAYLHDNIRMTAIDDHHVEVTLTDRGKSVSATLTIDDEGKLTNFAADRYNADAKAYYRWETPIIGYGKMGGLQLALAGQGVWQYPEGEFAYVEPVITEVQYNIAEPY